MADPASVHDRAQLRLFGRIALSTPAGEEVALSNRRARGLLAFTALQRGARASRARLAGLFWSDRAEAQARASLRQALTELKTTIGEAGEADVLDASREHIGLRLERLSIDVLELETALDAGAADALVPLLARIGVDCLCDEPAIGELHQEWLDEMRGYIEAKIAAGVHRLLATLDPSDPAAFCALAESFLRRQPLDEIATAALMRADMARGASSAAVIRYAAFKRALARDLEVAPGPALQATLRAALGRTVATPGAARDATPGAPHTVEPAKVPTVVVAAFGEDAAAEAGQGGTGEGGTGQGVGLREEILAALSRFRELSVVAESRPAEQIAREPWSGRQDVYLLSGVAQTRAGGVRLAVQLLHMADGAVLWSDRSTLASEAAEAAIDRVVGRVAAAVLPSIHADLIPRLAQAAQGRYARYLLAREAAARATTFAQARDAAQTLEALIAEAPQTPHAYLPLARLYNTDFGFTRAGASGPAERRRAFELSKAAVALDRGHAHGYTVVGWCYLWRGEWVVARRHFDQAVELNPFGLDRLMEVGFGSLFLGDLERARELLERCLQLNPTPKDGFFMDLGLLEMIEGRYDLAQAHFDMVASPTVMDDLYSAANAVLAQAPDPERSARAWARLEAVWPPGTPMQANAVATWFQSTHPFRDEAVAQRLSDAVRTVFAALADGAEPPLAREWT